MSGNVSRPVLIRCAFDGSCLGNPGVGAYAAVILINDKTFVRKSFDASTTNNAMELSAAIAALLALPEGSTVEMIGDSQYVIKGITQWLPGWKKRGWRTSGRARLKNRELWEKLDAAVSRHASVAWTWVKGHAGHPLNEQANRIAETETREALDRLVEAVE